MTLIFPVVSNTALSPSCQYSTFWQAIATQNETAFMAASQTNVLTQCLPEWERMRGACNTQHATHEFTLDVHTAKVLTKTRKSPYFQLLSAEMQELTTLAALLHDIAKEGGAASERFQLKPDMAHPVKAVGVVRQRLPQWGFSQYAVEVVSLLVAYHQAFGRWIMRSEFQHKEPSVAEIEELAGILRCKKILHGLQALTEGDIRGVKGDDLLFTPFAAEKLTHYGQQVQHAIQHIEQATTHQFNTLQQALATIYYGTVPNCLWLLLSHSKQPHTPQSSATPQHNLIAVLPRYFLTEDVDTQPCHHCTLKNQASGRIFTVSLILENTFNPQTHCCVGIFAHNIVGWEQQAEGILLHVQNPIALNTPE